MTSSFIEESTRCTVDMLSQILYDKTQDVGKTSAVLISPILKLRRTVPIYKPKEIITIFI